MSKTVKNAVKFMEDILKKTKEITFLFGSGISLPEPTNIPTVNTFYDRLMNVAEITDDIANAIWDKIQTISPQPRFESFVYQFQKEIDTDLKFASIFNVTSYNSIHSFLSQSIKNGSIGITTNFDECVEQSGLDTKMVVSYDGNDLSKLIYRNVLYKPHGTISSNKQIVITDEALSKTNNDFVLLPNWRSSLLNAINGRTLIVVGYSGSDDFDITPLLNLSNPKRVIWIRHEKHSLKIQQHIRNKLPY